MAYNIFSSPLPIRLGLPHLIAHVFFMHMCPTHTFDKDTQTLLCSRGKMHYTHDAIQNSFASITKDVGFCTLCEQTHVLLILFF
jgi:hypothetical protein